MIISRLFYRIEGWFAGRVSDMFSPGDSINPDSICLCGTGMHQKCLKEKECQLEHRLAWNRGESGAKEYLGLKGSGKLSDNKRRRIHQKCQARLKRCRKVFVEFGEK